MHELYEKKCKVFELVKLGYETKIKEVGYRLSQAKTVDERKSLVKEMIDATNIYTQLQHELDVFEEVREVEHGIKIL